MMQSMATELRIGTTIRKRRQALGMRTQQELAERIGVDRTTVPSVTRTVADNYSNPAVLAAAIEKILRNRLRNRSGPYYVPGVHPTGTTCVPHGKGRDFCVTSLSGDHSNVSETAIIAPDGNSFITK